MRTTLQRIALLAGVVACAGCNAALFPESMMNSLGASTYQQETSKHPVITGTPEARTLQEVGKRIAAATGKDYDWEFKLLDAPDVVNAFCLPGGKIAFYTGILAVARDSNGNLENGIATIMGHEVAHATLQHGNKRMTQGMGLNVGLAVVEAALSNWGGISQTAQVDIMKGLGLGARYGVTLPFSRDHESEADIQGLRYLIRAGYDPNEAPKLWERMAKMSEGKRPPEFESTHPDPLRRAQELREAIPKLLAEERAGQK